MTVAILITFFFLALAVDWQLERRKSQRATSTGRLEIQGFPKLTGLPAADRAAVLSRLLPARAIGVLRWKHSFLSNPN